MKELSTEEKAKAYDKAIERANFINGDNKAVPAWSLTTLLELMPIGSHIEKKNSCYACYIVYTKPLEASTPIEAAFEMVCWLIEQGHIKVNK